MSSLEETVRMPMSSFGFWRKVTRPHHCLAGALATYVIALLSDGHTWFNQVKIAGPCVIAIGIMGASLFHYGGARTIYARKWHDYVKVDNPLLLIALGLCCFLLSIFLAWRLLPLNGQILALFNCLAIILYTTKLARHWTTKNVLIALVCTTPVIMGWSTGHRLHEGTPLSIPAVFFNQWAREIRKDITDIRANHGQRVTLPMTLGIDGARKVAGLCSLLSLIFVSLLGVYFLRQPFYAIAPYLVALGIGATVAALLIFSHENGKEQNLITYANWFLILAFLGIRIHL